MRIVPLAAVLVLALAGCAPVAGVGSPTTGPLPTTTATPGPTEPATPPALVIGATGIDEVDASGSVIISAQYDDGQTVLDLVSDALGDPPAPKVTPFGDTYTWPEGISVKLRGPDAWVRFDVATAGDFALRTSEGIQVGSSRADVTALPTFDDGHDGDGDGASDTLGLEPREEPGTASLVFPGKVGTTFINVFFSGDAVTALVAPAGDWMDV